VARCLGKSWIIPGRRKRRTLRRAGCCFHDEGVATAFPASRLSRRGRRRKRRTGCCFTTRGWRRHFRPRTCHAEGEGGSDALGLFQDEGMATAFPASRLSRRGLGEGGSDSTSGFGHLLPKWRSVSQIPNSRPPTHPQFRYRASFFSLTSKLNHWSRALIHFLVAAPPGRGHSAD
jgi:hypothetical protein